MTFKKYKNQRGSILELDILPNNKIQGNFITAVASKECQSVIGKKQSIIGFWTGNAITFSVVYDQCGSLYSVTGNFDMEQNTIDVIGLINHQSNDIAGQDCGTRFIAHDIYTAIDHL